MKILPVALIGRVGCFRLQEVNIEIDIWLDYLVITAITGFCKLDTVGITCDNRRGNE